MDIIHLPFELWTLIFELLDIKLQVRLIQLCKTIKDKIFITDLCNIGYKFKIKLNGDIIKKYPYIKKLYAGWDSKIEDQNLVGLNLVELDAYNNPKIKKINHMTNLRILHASGDSGIDDDSLVGLNLVKLNASWNPKIKKINHMTNLRILNASENCGIEDEYLVGLNLVELKAFYNPKIIKKIDSKK